jgi:hypothetical protein
MDLQVVTFHDVQSLQTELQIFILYGEQIDTTVRRVGPNP